LGILRSDLEGLLSFVKQVSYKDSPAKANETAAIAGRPEGRRYAGGRRESPLDEFRRNKGQLLRREPDGAFPFEVDVIGANCEFDEGAACANSGVDEAGRFTSNCEFGRGMIRILIKNVYR
jgi:hypothetical protein